MNTETLPAELSERLSDCETFDFALNGYDYRRLVRAIKGFETMGVPFDDGTRGRANVTAEEVGRILIALASTDDSDFAEEFAVSFISDDLALSEGRSRELFGELRDGLADLD